MIDEWRRVTETGDRAELADLPEDSALWHDVSATAETCLGTECPQYRRVLRHADAPARRRVRRGDRQPSPAVRGRGGAAEHLRRGDSGLPLRGRSTKRTSSRTSPRSTSASPSATIASTTSCATRNGRVNLGEVDDRRLRAAPPDRARRRSLARVLRVAGDGAPIPRRPRGAPAHRARLVRRHRRPGPRAGGIARDAWRRR